AVETVAQPVLRLAHEDPGAFGEDGGCGDLPSETLHELRQPEAYAASLEAHGIQGEGPRSSGDGPFHKAISVPSTRQAFPVGGRLLEARAHRFGEGPDGGLG